MITQGKWEACEHTTGGNLDMFWIISPENPPLIAKVIIGGRTVEEHRADANLIAAAPDLLAACKELLEALDNLAEKNSRDKCWNGMDTDKNGDCVCTHCKANRAIAKAEGKP